MAAAFSVICVGCASDGLGGIPSAHETLLVTGGESNQLTIVDPSAGKVVGHIGPVPTYQDASTLSEDRTTLYLLGHDNRGGHVLAIDMVRGVVQSNLALPGDGPIPAAAGSGMVVYGDHAISISPDSKRLFIASAIRGATPSDTIPGIAVVDVATLAPTGFVGPLWVQPGGLVRVQQSATTPGGAILAVGRRHRATRPGLDWLFTIDPVTLAIKDSAALAPPSADGTPTLLGVVVAPDGHHAYVAGIDPAMATVTAQQSVPAGMALFEYNMLTRQVVSRVALPANGNLAISPDGGSLYLTDSGDFFTTPGSGAVYVFSGSLVPQDTIALDPLAASHPSTRGVSWSADGTRVYIATGTASIGPMYGPQPSRVIVIDAGSRRAVETIALGDWNPGLIYVR